MVEVQIPFSDRFYYSSQNYIWLSGTPARLSPFISSARDPWHVETADLCHTVATVKLGSSDNSFGDV